MIAPKVLVVEDESLLAFEMGDILKEAGYEVVGPVDTVAKALALIDSREPHAAFLDCNLDGESSTAVALTLTAKNIPFVVMTGFGRENLPDAFSNGIYAQKPFKAAHLLEMAQVLLRDFQN
jgi:DNA-binding response OmpR family regulator